MQSFIGWQTTRRRQFHKVKGFSSLELLAALIPALFIFLLGPPLLDIFSDPGEIQLLQGNSLAAHLEYARSEALRREQTITVCPSGDGRNCQLDGDWRHGWIIFTDEENPPLHMSVGDRLLHKQSGGTGDQPLVTGMGVVRYLADGSLVIDDG